MKLKYFLRGLGAGIIFSAVIMLVAYMTSGGYKLSDREIISRAEKLGMVMEDNDTEASAGDSNRQPEEDKAGEPGSTEDFTTTGASMENTEAPGAGFMNGAGPESTTERPQAEGTFTTQEPDATEKPQTDYTTVRITIKSGMGSEEVAGLLKDAGIITDAADFDSYLNDNGYSTRIETGTFEINSGMTYQEIAELLCKKPN